MPKLKFRRIYDEQKMNNLQLKFLVALLITGTLVMFYFFEPTDVSFFPACFFKKITGFDCPGCGGQRALHDLLHLRFQEAIDHNLLLVAGSPFLAFAGINAFFLEKKQNFTKKTLTVLSIFILLFWIVRNLPIAELAWLRA